MYNSFTADAPDCDALELIEENAMGISDQSQQTRNQANTRRNWAKVEQHLTEVEKAMGYAKAWALREQLEQGKITLDELKRR